VSVTAADLDSRADHPTWFYGSRVSPRWGYVNVTPGKCGCSTTKYALHELEGRPPVEGWWTVHDDDDEMSMSRFGSGTVAAMLNDAAVLKWCVVRNPYDRMFSAWKSKILRRVDTQYRGFRDRIRDHFGYPPGDDESARGTVAFGDFVRFVAAHPDDPEVARDGHWEPQTSVLWWDLVDYDVVCRFENFTADLTAVLTRLGAPDAVLQRASERHNETAGVPLSAAYDSDLAAVVYAFYRRDFDAFGYAEDSWHRYDSLLPTAE
jgi:hypothetical protein